jgi:uncharacterized damage-inducible protein DinB
MATTIARPKTGDYPESFAGYLADVADATDAVTALAAQQPAIAALARLTPEQASFRYADGKWSVKEVVGHIIDAERVFTYRLLRIARGDQTPLPPFDENDYAKRSNADRREMSDLARELAAVRESALTLVRSLDDDVLENRGTVRAGELTARAQAFVIAGHFQHHVRLLRERYGLTV